MCDKKKKRLLLRLAVGDIVSEEQFVDKWACFQSNSSSVISRTGSTKSVANESYYLYTTWFKTAFKVGETQPRTSNNTLLSREWDTKLSLRKKKVI